METEDESDESSNFKSSPTKHHPYGNHRTEPKYLVFLSHLLMLFKICPSCKADNPLVETTQCGTMVTVHTYCGNSDCKQRESVWHSQPNMEGTKIAAGNFLLSFAILLAGAAASKVLRVFSHMRLSSFSLGTFYNHQRVCKMDQLGDLIYKNYFSYIIACH